jgi:two-component system, OmpR family, sensor kinase
MRRPIRTRLTAVFAGLTLAVVVISGIALILRFRHELRHTIDEGLVDRAEVIAAADERPQAVRAVGRADETFAQLLDERGRQVLAASHDMGARPLPFPASIGTEEAGFLDAVVATAEEPVHARLFARRLNDGSILVIGQDIEDQREAVTRLGVLVAVGAPVLLVTLTLLGWILAGAALRPVERLRAEAAAISTIEPSRRLPVPRTGDELQRLAETLNDMLDRLNEALDRERRFVDEASHELRTPLGVLRAEVELALKGSRTRAELEAALRSVRQESERLSRLSQDLLVLARSDRGRLPVHRADVDVSDLLARVASEFGDRAGTQGVRLRSESSGVRANVDRDRIRQAMENLTDNALRHTGRGGEIVLRAERGREALRLEVIDSGTGFPPGLLDRVFEPFARVDGRGNDEGAGLGLAIVKAVAEAHGGTATAENAVTGGAAVRIELPL